MSTKSKLYSALCEAAWQMAQVKIHTFANMNLVMEFDSSAEWFDAIVKLKNDEAFAQNHMTTVHEEGNTFAFITNGVRIALVDHDK